VRGLLLLVCLLALQAQAARPDWLIAAPQARVAAGQAFELVVIAPAGEPLPDEISARLRWELGERIVQLRAAGPAENGRRDYAGVMPPELSGTVSIELAERSSSVAQLAVAPPPGARLPTTGRRAPGEYEPPLSENDPMYFIVGARDGYSARFQLSFKYRLFDTGSGFGRDQPWLSGFYFGYTQNAIWDLSSASKAFRDTSYRPQFFWKWDRADEKTLVDSFRVGLEHESNGGDLERSRSINIAFVRPEWHHGFANGHEIQLMPKLYRYLDKDENPDIHEYRGHVDWQLRYDAAGEWVGTALFRRGTARRSSLQLDLSRRARDLRFGPVGGYFHVQYFNGYGESILDYNLRRKAQLRIGFAIVP
jgi:phospholipase A1